jgi:phosphonate transport system substrate-binding protein
VPTVPPEVGRVKQTSRWIAVALLGALVLGVTAVAPQSAVGQTSLVLAFVPSQDSQRVLETGSILARMIEVATGYRVRAEVPTSYVSTVEAMCAGRVDIAFLAPFAYVLANQKCDADVRLVSVRASLPFYKAQIMYRADLAVKDLNDLRGKRFAFVTPASASGYLFPAALLKKRGIDPDRFFSQVIFAGGHDRVVLAIYTGSVDAGAGFGDEVFSDSRTTVERQYRDVKDKVKVLMYTDPIPNDTVSFRKGLPEDVKERTTKALFRIAETAPGKETLDRLYQIQGFADFNALTTTYKQTKLKTFDEYFQPIRDAAKFLGLNLEEMLRR